MPLQSEVILVDKKTAAFLLSISLRTLEYLIARKEIGVRKIGRRCLISRKDLERFARADHKSPSRATENAKVASFSDATAREYKPEAAPDHK